ncbi:Transcriptional regulatory protein FixJ [wastewater metagenome]|uniref:Transcriptional regulatory protein FixJ n=2 Tax=unclassified sequences TaxID=12908 RepID=A0A5B8RCV7_9ZZZZ|nr:MULTISPECIES: response regulator [Arhodomonas]QEA06506.1 transcriptional regulatory protein FixJ [uncultured organism]
MTDERALTVAVVDDDPDFRDSLRWLLSSVHLPVTVYPDGESLLAELGPEIGCILLDVRMPGMSGIQVQERLNALGVDAAVLIVTGHGDVPMAVHALKHGAFDFIEKPFNDQQLIDSVQQALEHTRRRRARHDYAAALRARFDALRPKERDILRLAALGCTNRQIGEALGVSAKTAEIYRLRAMKAMQARDLAHWVRMAERLEILPPLDSPAGDDASG